MNRVLATILCCSAAVLLCVPQATSGEMTVKFREITSFQQALDVAKAENKYVFVDAYTDWCGWCKVMDRETFTNEEVGQVMNAGFVSVKIEMESGFGIDVAMKYGVRSFPTFLVLASDGRLVQRISGYMPPANFVPVLHQSLDPKTQAPEPGYRPGVVPQFPDFMRGAFLKGKERKMPDSSAVSGWLKGQKDWSTEEAWGVISTLHPKMADEYVVSNRTMLKQKYGSSLTNSIESMVSNKVMRAAKDQDEQTFTDAIGLKHLVSEGSITADSVNYRLYYYSTGKNWSKLSSTLVYGAQEDLVNLASVNRYAWDMYEQCDDKAALVQATEAMNIGIQKEKGGYEELDTYAALLYKTKCYPQAEQAAVQAIEAGKAKGADVAGTQELLGKIREVEKSKTRE